MDLSNIKFYIFDVDGTLTATKSGATFRKSADDWQWLPGRLEKLRELQQQGKHLGLATNQGGVAFGYMRQEDIHNAIRRMADEVSIHSGMVEVCYSHPKASIELYRKENDERRKPGPGMILHLISNVDCAKSEVLFVGDRDEDEQAARAAGIEFVHADVFFG